MFRFAVAASIAIVSTAVFAQTDPVAERKGLMDDNARFMYRAFPAMIKGAQPYDQATVDAGIAQMEAAAAKLPELYAVSTKSAPPTGRFSASPKVWESKVDFDKRLADFAASVAAAKPKATSLDGLKQVYPAVSAACDSCHDRYRVRN